METNIYYQLAQTECALERCKRKLFRKNLALLGMAGVAYFFAKAFAAECKKYLDTKKDRDDLAEKHDKTLDESKTIHCDGHATLSNG